MIKGKKFNLLKTMLKTSYNASNMINPETKKINKRSVKVWVIGILSMTVIYLSYAIVNGLKDLGTPEIFLELFFFLLSILVMMETVLLVISTMYFAEDIENYLPLPIPSVKLFLTKFAVMMGIIYTTEALIALPAIFIYGVRTIANVFFYPLTIIILFQVSLFLSMLITIAMIIIMRIFRFIKNKFLYQNIIVFVMTMIILIPVTNVFRMGIENSGTQIVDSIEQSQEQMTEEGEEASGNDKNVNMQIEKKQEEIKVTGINNYFIVVNSAIEALTDINIESLLYILKILGTNMFVLVVLTVIGKKTYVKDILINLSIFEKKKHKKINVRKRCKRKGKRTAYLINEVNNIIKSPTNAMNYIYNILIILYIFILLIVTIWPVIMDVMCEIAGEEILKQIVFDFKAFTVIIIGIQLFFTISTMSLTAMSRYGKNAIFYKYIPIKFKAQFKLKTMPQIVFNAIIILSIILTIYYLIPSLSIKYLVAIFIVAMLLNVINSYILFMIDLLRPQLNYENEISVIKQNDNKMFKYILTGILCLILWYIEEVTEKLSMDIAILIEIVVFLIVLIALEIIIHKKAKKLFERII